MKRLILAAALLPSVALAQTAPPSPKPPPEQLITAQVQIPTIDRMLTFLSMDGGSMATELAAQLRQQVIPQIQAFQQRQKADADRVAAETKAAEKPAEPKP